MLTRGAQLSTFAQTKAVKCAVPSTDKNFVLDGVAYH